MRAGRQAALYGPNHSILTESMRSSKTDCQLWHHLPMGAAHRLNLVGSAVGTLSRERGLISLCGRRSIAILIKWPRPCGPAFKTVFSSLQLLLLLHIFEVLLPHKSYYFGGRGHYRLDFGDCGWSYLIVLWRGLRSVICNIWSDASMCGCVWSPGIYLCAGCRTEFMARDYLPQIIAGAAVEDIWRAEAG